MDAKTLEALRGSIEKWEKIAAGTGLDMANTNCPLCQLFRSDVYSDTACHGCPVMERTGHQVCDKSPYKEFAALKSPDVKYFRSKWKRGYRAVSDKAKEVALAELDFLKSLLPSEAE